MKQEDKQNKENIDSFSEIVNQSTVIVPTQELMNNRYLIEKELGKGNIGVVFLARDIKVHSRRVVVKMLLEKNLNSPEIKSKFELEPRALAAINHPGVVSVLDIGKISEEQSYFVMEYVEGYTLTSVIKLGNLGFARIANIIRQIGEALSAAHKGGVIHRDLKPDNIMLQKVGSDEKVKIVDFGVATMKAPEVIKEEGTMIAGTREYMAPEQLQYQPTYASDIFALGIIACEMITGQRPFEKDVQKDNDFWDHGIIKFNPRQLRPELSIKSEQILLKALAFKPEERYSNAAEFGNELADSLTNTDKQPDNNQQIKKEPNKTVAILGFLFLSLLLSLALWPYITPYLTTKQEVIEPKIDRQINYWLTVQRYRNGKPYEKPFQIAKEVIFEKGDRVKLNFSSPQKGYLYIINEGPQKIDNLPAYNVLFPSSIINSGEYFLKENLQVQIPSNEDWFVLDNEEGTEKVWVIWSNERINQLEKVKDSANSTDQGQIKDKSKLKDLEQFFLNNSKNQPQLMQDDNKKQTHLAVNANLLIVCLRLEHH